MDQSRISSPAAKAVLELQTQLIPTGSAAPEVEKTLK